MKKSLYNIKYLIVHRLHISISLGLCEKVHKVEREVIK